MIYDVGLGKLRVRFSPDGIRWTEPVEPRGFGPQNGDTHNNFAGYEPATAGGTATIVTQPLVAGGEPLRVSADIRGGAVRVAVLDAAEFGTAPSAPLTADVTDGLVSWPDRDFRSLQGRTIRLQFTITGAKLYAFSGLRLL